MRRMLQQTASRRGAFAACVLVLLVMSLLPRSWSGWLGGFHSLSVRLVAPIAEPVTWMSRWVLPGRGSSVEDEVVAELRREAERFQALYLRERERTADLERRIREFQQGLAFTEMPVRQVSAAVIGRGADGAGGSLLVRAGARQGVEVNNVVTAGGVQVVGQVVRTGSRQCEVRLLTAVGTGRVLGVVMLEDGTMGPLASLFPLRGRGVLQGEVEYRGTSGEVRVGQVVRLRDDQWPRSAAMLVLGRVEEVRTIAGGRPLVTVRPTLDLERLSEVIVRTHPSEEDGGGGSGGGG